MITLWKGKQCNKNWITAEADDPAPSTAIKGKGWDDAENLEAIIPDRELKVKATIARVVFKKAVDKEEGM